MKLGYLTLPSSEQQLYIQQAALKRDVSEIIIEKDFWVCWLLAILFKSEFREFIVFKGGTSLSKVFNVIERFSEDIDISLAPEFLDLPEPGTSRNQAAKWMAKAESACGVAVETRIRPVIEKEIGKVIGTKQTWLEYAIDPVTNSPILRFHYPTLLPEGFSYIPRSVKIEFGSLTDQQPTGQHKITPWIQEVYPQAFPEWSCEIVALEIERTFWEKATILHAEYHRPSDKVTPDRFSRHYADTASLAAHPNIEGMLSADDILKSVVAFKSRFFGSTWANYETAKRGTFRLVPPESRIKALKADYKAMNDMYLVKPLSFEAVISTLKDLETRINNG